MSPPSASTRSFLWRGTFIIQKKDLRDTLHKKLRTMILPYYLFGLGYYVLWLLAFRSSGRDIVEPLRSVLFHADGRIPDRAVNILPPHDVQRDDDIRVLGEVCEERAPEARRRARHHIYRQHMDFGVHRAPPDGARLRVQRADLYLPRLPRAHGHRRGGQARRWHRLRHTAHRALFHGRGGQLYLHHQQLHSESAQRRVEQYPVHTPEYLRHDASVGVFLPLV